MQTQSVAKSAVTSPTKSASIPTVGDPTISAAISAAISAPEPAPDATLPTVDEPAPDATATRTYAPSTDLIAALVADAKSVNDLRKDVRGNAAQLAASEAVRIAVDTADQTDAPNVAGFESIKVLGFGKAFSTAFGPARQTARATFIRFSSK